LAFPGCNNHLSITGIIYNRHNYVILIMDWIDLAQDKDRWQALVNAVMNLRDT
jgi:hypothetical protein